MTKVEKRRRHELRMVHEWSRLALIVGTAAVLVASLIAIIIEEVTY